MGNRCSTVEDEDIKQLRLIPDDISRNVVLIKGLKTLSERVEKLEKQKQIQCITDYLLSIFVTLH